MKGNPLWELVLVAILFAMLLPPMYHVTRSREKASHAPLPHMEQPARRPALKVPTLLTLRFAHAPLSFVIHKESLEIWNETPDLPSETVFDHEVKLPVTQGMELRVEVTWPEGTPATICELTLEPDGFRASTTSAWSQGNRLLTAFNFIWTER